MSLCLVQQLFRQKIGKELDSGLVEEVLFPMLRQRKHPSKELLQDIKLTSEILIVPDYARREAGGFSIPTFTPIPEYWLNPKTLPNGQPDHLWGVPYRPPGKRASKVLRRIRRSSWGTIDILNELRELNYPQMGYRWDTRPTAYFEEKGDFPGDEFDGAYIRLEEDDSLPPNSLMDWSSAARRSARRRAPGRDWTDRNRVAVEGRARFVNDFLEDALVSGKRLTWDNCVLGWDPCKLPLHPPFQYLCRQYEY